MKRYILRCKCNVQIETEDEKPEGICVDCSETLQVSEDIRQRMGISYSPYRHTLYLKNPPLFKMTAQEQYFNNVRDSLRMQAEDSPVQVALP